MKLKKRRSFRCFGLVGAFHMEFHQHRFVEINYMEKGTALYTVDGQEIPLKKGNVIVINAKYKHKLEITDPAARVISIEVDIPFLENDIKYELIKDECLIGMVTRDILNAYYCKELSSYLDIGISYLIELVKKQRKSSYAIQAKMYISDNYMQIHDIGDVAGYLNISKVHLQRVFKKETGHTIGEYISRIKIMNAAYLLKNTDIPICDIDLKIGMRSRQAFYHSFKKIFGISPQTYRKNSC